MADVRQSRNGLKRCMRNATVRIICNLSVEKSVREDKLCPIERTMTALRKSLTLVTFGGSLCMVYLACVNSPIFIAFMLDLGATEFHIGLVNGLPLFMLLLQFVGAVMANRMTRRKPAFILLIIAGRLIYLPIALLPLFAGGSKYIVEIIVVLVALSSGVANVIGPAWFSWMADIVPRPILNRYWASRHRVLQLTWLVCSLLVGWFAWATDFDSRMTFLILAAVGVTAGVIDILLFIWVREPPNHIVKGESIARILADPFKSSDFRSFLVFQCVWSFTAMFGAAFMQLHAMKWLGLGEGLVTLIWCAMIMNALSAPYWGRLADRHGHRSILAICTSMKPLVVVMFLLVTPRLACTVLPIGMFIDGIWNAGLFVATNGYMMKISPRRNRSVFVASITGLSGIFGGLGAVCGGAFLRSIADFHLVWLDREWCNFHVLFAMDIIMRIGCAFLVYHVKEPESTEHDEVLTEVRGFWPMRYLLFPVGFYRMRVLPALKGAAELVNQKRPDGSSAPPQQ